MPRLSLRPFFLALLLAVSGASADVVHLRGGGRVEGKVTESGDEIRVVMAGGTVTFPKSEVSRIERSELPAEAVDRRRRALKDGDAQGALEVALAAHSAGLSGREGELLELAVGWAPGNREAAAALRRWAVHDRRLPLDDAAAARLLVAFGEAGASVYRTPHFLVAHNVPASEVRRRSEMLEAAWRKFHDLADHMDLLPTPVDRRLPVMLFSTHAQWRTALGLPDSAVAGMNGMYVHRAGRVLLYDTNTAPWAVDAKRRIADEVVRLDEIRGLIQAQRARVAELEASLGDIGDSEQAQARREHIRTWLGEAREKLSVDERSMDEWTAALSDNRAKLDRYFERENLASTTHEACHQISFATGICRPGQPLWIVEGLATLFEISSRASFVIESPNSARLADVRRAWGQGNASSLEDVVSDQVFHDKDLPRSVAYAESWSLAHFLARKRPETLARFVLECEGIAGPAPGPRRLADFRAHFGDDLDSLDRAWKAYVNRL